MPALNFRPEFADLVESGRKTQTIRPHRAKGILPGQHVYLFTGMRTRHCRRLGEGVVTSVREILIDGTGLAPSVRAAWEARCEAGR